jgi:hypothetical protein
VPLPCLPQKKPWKETSTRSPMFVMVSGRLRIVSAIRRPKKEKENNETKFVKT